MSKITYINIPSDFRCSDLYSYVIRRSFYLLSETGMHGFIVMHNLAFSKNFKDLRRFFKRVQGSYWFSFYSRIPSGLFSGDVRVRNTIYIYSRKDSLKMTSRMRRWFTEQRHSLFQDIKYSEFKWDDVVPMLNDNVLQSIFENKKGISISSLKDTLGDNLYYKKVAYNWLVISNLEPPTYNENGELICSSGVDVFRCNKKWSQAFLLLASGKLYFTKWLIYGDDFHYTSSDLCNFAFPFNELSASELDELNSIYSEYITCLPKTLKFKLNAGKNVGTYNTKDLWHLTNKSDSIFLRHLTKFSSTVNELIENHISLCVLSDKKKSKSCMDIEEYE